MSAKDVKGQALWRHRGAVIAPLILISLVGLGLVGSAQGGCLFSEGSGTPARRAFCTPPCGQKVWFLQLDCQPR